MALNPGFQLVNRKIDIFRSPAEGKCIRSILASPWSSVAGRNVAWKEGVSQETPRSLSGCTTVLCYWLKWSIDCRSGENTKHKQSNESLSKRATWDLEIWVIGVFVLNCFFRSTSQEIVLTQRKQKQKPCNNHHKKKPNKIDQSMYITVNAPRYWTIPIQSYETKSLSRKQKLDLRVLILSTILL